MNYDDSKTTPLPMPVGSIPQSMMERERAITGAIQLGMQQSPPPPPDQFSMLWKTIVGICVGLSAIAVVVWVLARQFFVTRDEWVEQSGQIREIANQVTQSQKNVQELTTNIKEMSTILTNLNLKLMVMEASSGKRR